MVVCSSRRIAARRGVGPRLPTGSHPALTPSGVQSGSFGPFGQAPRPERVQVRSGGAPPSAVADDEPASVIVDVEIMPAQSTPPPAPEPRKPMALWVLTLIFIVFGLAAGVAVAMMLR